MDLKEFEKELDGLWAEILNLAFSKGDGTEQYRRLECIERHIEWLKDDIDDFASIE